MVKGIFVKTAVLSLMIFAAGIFFGLYVGQEKVSDLEQTTINLQSSIETAELQFALLDILEPEIACNYLLSTADDLGAKSDLLALEVERYENTQKIDEASFNTLKKEYTSTLIKNWITLEKVKETCTSNYTTMLYFYSNENCDKCDDQGIVLTYLKDRMKQDLMIFALDTDLQLTTVNALKDSYAIEEFPTIIVEDEKYTGYYSVDEMTKILCDYNNNWAIC